MLIRKHKEYDTDYIFEGMRWCVYAVDINLDEPYVYNVLEHIGFANDIVDAKKRYPKDIDEFSEHVYASAMYYFWSKCEWEFEITPLFNEKNAIKIDVRNQLDLNWDRFIDYIFKNTHPYKKKKEVTNND